MPANDVRRRNQTRQLGDGQLRERIGPLLLRPIFEDRIWGVETLPDWYPEPASGQRVGEVWLTSETCVAESGALRGRTLAELVKRHPVALGALFDQASPAGFPLLLKLLFPRDKLSVQVHPDDTQAQALGLARGKTECWYVLSAEVGAQVAVGFREELTTQQIRTAIEQRTIEDKLRYLPVKAGDMVYVDAGTVHAIGAGMVVLETQQYSDVTYRLYDYGRPRELHLDTGLRVSRASTAAGFVSPAVMEGFDRLVRSRYFVVDRFVVQPGIAAELGKAGQMQMLVALAEGCSLESGAGDTLALPPGWAVVLPGEEVEYMLHGAGEVIRIAQS